jgi:hypothetical protein
MQPQRSPNSSEPGRLAPGARLMLCIAALAVGWLLLLPWVAQSSPVQSMIKHNEELGVDPSAKFYSELPAMPEIVQDVRRRREQSEAF